VRLESPDEKPRPWQHANGTLTNFTKRVVAVSKEEVEREEQK
jgi:hypothetical protein